MAISTPTFVIGLTSYLYERPDGSTFCDRRESGPEDFAQSRHNDVVRIFGVTNSSSSRSSSQRRLRREG